jgi:DNA helicase TIP49 (TBP-interacting protein)
VINPVDQRVWEYKKTGSAEIVDGVLRTENPSLEVPLAEIFGEL